MVQAHARELLNQKESRYGSSGHSSSYSPQHPIFTATDRLVKALERLEGNLHNITVGQDRELQQQQQLHAFERENEALHKERENLNGAIEQLQYQYNDLHEVASAIYGKLDDSIKRLTQIIEQ